MAIERRNVIKQLPEIEKRNWPELLEHYELEKNLATRLRNSTREERKHLYNELYNELFEKIPYFQNRISDKQKRFEAAATQIQFLKCFLRPGSIFMELGAGDSALSIQLCALQKKVFAIDVCYQIPARTELPDNFNFSIRTA